jgi:hypothetical protein
METKMRRTLVLAVVIALAMILLSGCRQKMLTEYEGNPAERPEYLPEAMFKELPEMPADFYKVREMVRSGEIRNLNEIWPEYYLQPEWFPGFEESGVPLLQNPPEDRWGAFGLGSYPSDTSASLVVGETLALVFYMRSSYLVETYQGISLVPVFPKNTALPEGFAMADGTTSITQEPSVSEYFDVEVSPSVFLIEPNFPIYSKQSTQKVEVRITAKETIPLGNYVVAIDVGDAPLEQEEGWAKEHQNKYAGSSITKIGRPYYQAFIKVGLSDKTRDRSDKPDTTQEKVNG